jgi:hypothetical protein
VQKKALFDIKKGCPKGYIEEGGSEKINIHYL